MMDEKLLENYSAELKTELQNILDYWMKFTPDEVNGGFYGKINDENTINAEAPKGAVLNARILWTFSAAYNLEADAKYLAIADRAYDYIVQHFIDKEYGGIYWSVDIKGNPLDTKKQIYALAFLQYACSEYYKCSQLPSVKQLAIDLCHQIEQHSFDAVRGGYFEAFTRDWKPIEDMRLSAKDANEQKTMNTHLHVLESYTNLYCIWPDEKLKHSIQLLLGNFIDCIFNSSTGHLNLFFNEDWVSKKDIISYGHDIEAAWLMQEAAEVIDDAELVAKTKSIAIQIAHATEEGLDTDGGLWYEKENGHLIRQKHWWPQAEAMVGFLNAWQINGDEKHLYQSINSWNYIKQHLLNKQYGEWFWGIGENGQPMQGEDKVGLWKCPYHNARACMEVIERLDELISSAE